MPVLLPRELPHLFASDYGKKRDYRAPSAGGGEPPRRDKVTHGRRLKARLSEAVEQAKAEAEANLVALKQAATGIYLTFQAAPSHDLPIERLERIADGIEVIHAQTFEGVFQATVFVPTGKEGFFARKIQEYMTKLTSKGKPSHSSLVAAIDDIESASLIRLWADDPRHFPVHGQSIWWEVWVRATAEADFTTSIERLGLNRGERTLHFPERVVFSVEGTIEAIDRLRYLSGALAELRRLQETPHFFVEQEAAEQGDWGDDLTRRLTAPAFNAPAVCVLDTGINRGHPLLSQVLHDEDCHAWDPRWPKGDNQGARAHGTAMAGIAAYGDLQAALEARAPITLQHRLESVRILAPGGTPNKREAYGVITTDAVGQAEYQAPDRRRAFCMAVTADPCDGRPSSWSATVDDLAAGKLDDVKRLFILSAGNVRDAVAPCDDYLYRCQRTPSQDPAQAWNALVVGACTFRQAIANPVFAGWRPLANPGELSPYSSTTCDWDPRWAIRPDVVVEGGNLAVSSTGADWDSPPCLGLLTTSHDIPRRLFDTIHATSAASAQVAWMAGRALTNLPDCWEETLRALIIHSAEWPQDVASQFAAARMSERGRLLRTYGFGVPDLQRVLTSARNDVAIVVENEMTVVAADGTMPEMHYYELPWPVEQLRQLDRTPIKLKVTLSYFVESNPAARGWKGRYRYMSHGFRFHLKRSLESDSEFFSRLNMMDRDDGWERGGGGDDGWTFGARQRSHGSIHSDIWEGEAVTLAERRKLAVVPVGGWWKRPHSPERKARYSLVVSLATPETDLDIYASVKTTLANIATIGTPVVI